MDNQQINELKAKAYDLMALIERAQAEFRQVNQQIAQFSQPEVKEEPKAKEVKE